MNRINLYADNYPNFSTQFITQGKIGNCWLISVLISLSLTEKGKSLLSDIFYVNQDGTYTIKLYNNVRKPNYITFEPLFTVEKDENNNLQMLFSGANLNIPQAFANNPSTDLIWSCIIEKAISKYLGSIKKQDGNTSMTAFNLLTNNEVFYVLNMSMNKRFFDKFIDLLKNNKICGTLETKPVLNEKYNYLIINHAYSIFKLDGKNLHLINPHVQFTGESTSIIVNIDDLREYTDNITYIYL